ANVSTADTATTAHSPLTGDVPSPGESPRPAAHSSSDGTDDPLQGFEGWLNCLTQPSTLPPALHAEKTSLSEPVSMSTVSCPDPSTSADSIPHPATRVRASDCSGPSTVESHQPSSVPKADAVLPRADSAKAELPFQSTANGSTADS